MSKPGMLTVEELDRHVASGEIDTVLVAITDMQGRLQGKRLHARYFLDEVLQHGTEGCNYLLAVDVDMNTVDGYAMSSWSTGYGDFVMTPDLTTLRRVPWQAGTVMLLADLGWHDGSDVTASLGRFSSGRRLGWPTRGCRRSQAPNWSSSSSTTATRTRGRRPIATSLPPTSTTSDYSMLGTAGSSRSAADP